MRWAEGFIAVDWGTTNRRAYRLDSSGKCTGEFEDHRGVLSIPAGTQILRFLPALNLHEAEAQEGLEIVESVVGKLAA